MKNKILIVEDEKQLAMFLKMELVHEGYTVDITYDGRSALEKITNNIYDIILLDIMLPMLNGIEVLRRLRSFTDVPVIILTARDEITDKVMGLDVGANDYITKPFAIEELLARIRVLTRKKADKIATSILKVNDLTLDKERHEVKYKDSIINLTKREFDLLEFLLINHDIVLTREQLLEKIWDIDFFGETNVVDVYIRYLRAKIDEVFKIQFITTIRGVGYVIRSASK